MDWPRFLRFLLVATGAFGSALYAFILILDPYQNVPFSPDLPRAPISQNQRFAYPAIARSPDFEGLIVGTSTVRLLDPSRLSAMADVRFANLAMNSATAFEQQKIYRLFARHHPRMRYLVLGLDETWCTRSQHIERYTFRDFPEWMYDDDRYNDLLYLFNDKALENAVRMLQFLGGRRAPKYGRDGYFEFTKDFGPWDAVKVSKRLFGSGVSAINAAPVNPTRLQPLWKFTLMDTLGHLVGSAPKAARILLLFPPLHARYIERRAELLSECKGRVEVLAEANKNVEVLDYMYVSEMTRKDENYWDPVHFTRNIAEVIENDIAVLIRGDEQVSMHARVYGRGLELGD